MTILKGEISEKINREFRKLAMKRFGYEKGAISKAIEEAILKWIIDQNNIDSEEERERIINNEFYQKEKKKLFIEYPNKIISICNGDIAEIGDNFSLIEKKTKENHPNVKHCLIINTAVQYKRRRAGLGWQLKRIKK